MATVASIMAGKQGPAVASAQAGQVTVQRGTYDLAQPDAEDATIQIRVVKLPAAHRIIGLVLDNPALDVGSAGAIDIGLEDDIQDPGDTTDLTMFATAIDVQTAANRQDVMSHAAAVLAPQNYDRYIVVTMETVSTTGIADALGLTLTSQPDLGAQFLGNE
jgi:hypothetical protein